MTDELEMKSPMAAQSATGEGKAAEKQAESKPTPKAPPTTKTKKSEPKPAPAGDEEGADESGEREDPAAHLESVSEAVDHPTTRASDDLDVEGISAGKKAVFQVTLPHNPAHFVEAPNRTMAEKLYAEYMGITGTAHKYGVSPAGRLPADAKVVRLSPEGIIGLS